MDVVYNIFVKPSSKYTNSTVSELLRDVAAAYKLENEQANKFRIVAYERAADAIEHLSSEIKDIWEEGKLDDIPGVGSSITTHLTELFSKGESSHFKKILAPLPPAMFELMKVPGIGPKTAFRLAKEFSISPKDPLKQLKEIAAKGAIRDLEGFGVQSEKEILQSLTDFKEIPQRMLLSTATPIAEDILAWMRKHPAVVQANALGSLRRQSATVGDLDIAVATDKPKEVLEHFTKYPKTYRVTEKGDAKAVILLLPNIHVDLMVQPTKAYGALLQHFTGSKHHNVALREYAIKKGLSLSEKGIKDTKKKSETIIPFKDEKSFYEFLGLNYIPPELRENGGEIEASLKHTLPDLIELADIKGDLQIHSNFDIETSHDVGASSMQEIIAKAASLKYEYVAFTEHNPSQSKHTFAQITEVLKRKQEVVSNMNTKLSDMKTSVKKVFNSLEIDILPSGKLPVDDNGLATLDFALVSIHSSFRLPKKQMTERILKALAHPKVKIFAHPSARIINRRESIECDWEKIFKFCAENNKYIEINADPSRLDLPDFLIRDALLVGVKFSMGTDAHHADGMDNMRYGVSVARRGWVTKRDIINTRGLSDFEKLMQTS